MTFLQNKYTHWYFDIINSRVTNIPIGYGEKHHIIPRSLEGSDEHTNIVKLTAREHYVCHKLLVKMFAQGTLGRQKMSLALHKMSYGTNASKYMITASEYESVKKLNVEAIRVMQKERFKDPSMKAKQIEYALNASKAAAKINRNNPVYSATCSRRVQKLVREGTHNFLGGEMQKAMWEDPEFREKQHQLNIERIENGTHPFLQSEFIEKQRIRLTNEWANMTPEKRIARGRLISEGRAKGKAAKKANNT